VTIRMSVSSVSEQGRATQGVKLIRVDEGDEIAAITKLDEEPEVEEIVNEEGSEQTNEVIGEEATNTATTDEIVPGEEEDSSSSTRDDIEEAE